MSEGYIREAWVKKNLIKYYPHETAAKLEQPLPENTEPAEEYNYILTEATSEPKINQFITALQSEINEDIIGWITIPRTKIDYPIAISDNNNRYLRSDLFGNYALAGSIFMDYRCQKDFSGFNSIIYGHNMKNDSMFGDLPLFCDIGFFDSNRYGTLFLKDCTYTLEFFAYMVIEKNDEMIYNPYAKSADRDDFIEYVREFARNYRELDTVERVVILSTCSGDGNARSVLLANTKT
jgi:sortase B